MNAPPEHEMAAMLQAVPGGTRSLERRRLQAYLGLLLADIVVILACFALAGFLYLDLFPEPRNLLAAQSLLPLTPNLIIAAL